MRNRSDQDNGNPAGAHLSPDDLNAYLDGLAGEGERARIIRHLDACADCREEHASLQATTALLQTLPEPRPRRSFQLGPEHTRSRRTLWDRLGLRLVPALPALRAATVAVALLLAGVTAAGWFEDNQDSAPSSEQLAQVAPTATTANDSARYAEPAAAEEAMPTQPDPNPAAPAAAPAGAAAEELGEPEAMEDATTGDGAAAERAAPTAAGNPTVQIAADDQAAEPPTDEEVAEGGAPAAPALAAETADGTGETTGAVGNGAESAAAVPNAPASPTAAAIATVAPVTPTASPALSPSTPASPPGGATAEVSGTNADDPVSGWRIAQIVSATLLVCLLGLIGIARRVPKRAAT